MRQNRKVVFSTLILLLFLPLLLFAVKSVIDLRKGAAGSPANIFVDLKTTQGTVPSTLWQNLAQGGEEPQDMIAPVIVQTRQIQPKLIRVDHLFDYYKVYVGPDNYDFSKLDAVVNSIVATGARPMLSLSYTTPDMAENNQNAGPPKDWQQWYNLVKATANRYSVQKAINGIYYEVWNEPDLFGGWHYGKNPSYTTLYTQSARAVMDGAASSVYKIGGPATTAYYQNWIKSLLKTASSNNLRLDFISWHRYSKNMSDYERDFENINSLLSDYPNFANVEKIITEIGPNPEPDPWYDNQLSAIHLMSLSTRLAGKIHRIFTFEVVDGPTSRSNTSSGWGLITHSTNGHKIKPRYQALEFLNQLKGQRLQTKGDGSWVTSLSSKNGNTIQTLLVNYDPRNTHSEAVPLSYLSLTPGTYEIKTTTFMGKTTTKQFTTNASFYRENLYLDPNTAVMLELTPISSSP